MNDIRFYTKPGINASGMFDEPAERISYSEMQKSIAKAIYGNDLPRGYRVVTYEEIQGTGPVCWEGEREYIFDDLREAQEFICERLATMGEQSEDMRLYDGDTPTEQFIITDRITTVERV